MLALSKPRWSAFVQWDGGMHLVGERSSLDRALALARKAGLKLGLYSPCVCARRADLPEIDPEVQQETSRYLHGRDKPVQPETIRNVHNQLARIYKERREAASALDDDPDE